MLPVFGDERKRKINLGGASSASSRSAILNQAQVRRTERLEERKRQEGAVKLQAWWRGLREERMGRKEMRRIFEQDMDGLRGLRCLVLIGSRDEEALAMWSMRMVQSGDDMLFRLARSDSWLVLVRQVCFLLLRSVSKSPLSSCATYHLKVLNTLLSATVTEKYLGVHGAQVTAEITTYLLQRDLHVFLGRAIKNIPIESRNEPSLQLLIPLTALPLQTFPSSTLQFSIALTSIFTQILTIPLLLYRLPPPSLTYLSSKIPFDHLPLVDITPFTTGTISGEDKLHLIATLHVLTPPRYQKIKPDALSAYLRLLTLLLNAIPIFILNPPQKRTAHTWDDTHHDLDDADSDSDSPGTTTKSISVSVVSSFDTSSPLPPPPIPTPDPRILKRLATLPSPTHIAALLSRKEIHSTTVLPALIECLFALSTIWPAVLGAVLATGAGLVREVYRGYVRGSVLGKDASASTTLLNHRNSKEWPALLFLTDLYEQALRTMGDDEFFGASNSGTGSGVEAGGFTNGHVLGSSSSSLSGRGVGGVGPTQTQRNPLTLDELRSFSRQLLNIAFVLYWREDGGDVNGGMGVMARLAGASADGGGGTVRCTWEGVREKVTRCLVGIHARDSRKPFLPPDHWLVTSQIDVQSFVEAAIFEEQQLSTTNNSHLAHPPAHTKRQLAYLSPRLGVLNNIPFSIPFDVRVSIFRNFVYNDAMQHSQSRAQSQFPVNPMQMWMRSGSGKTRVQVRRGSVAQDGFDRLGEADLKAPVEITFIDQFGAEEAGIDGGGVFKEFFTSLCKEVFDTDRGLWLANVKNELYPNPHAYATEGHSLNWYRFIGRILGKAMYEGILVDVAFAGFFLAKWLGRQSFLDDLESLDPDLYNGLIFLKHYTGNLEDLALNFTVAIDEFGSPKTIDLVPNGSNIAVTRENRLQYIYLVSHYRLSKQIKAQSEAFFEGLSEMIDRRWIRMFNQQEVQILLGGVNAPIDFDDLRGNTNYGGLYDDNEATIVAFWKVVNSFNQEQRMALLRFVTSCSRPPLLGFKELVPNFSIRDSGQDQLRLPTASTCVNLLKLPLYKSEKVLREKLIQAITSNAGFDLS